MTAETQDLKTLLLSTDDEFRQLAEKHQELEERTSFHRPHLSEQNVSSDAEETDAPEGPDGMLSRRYRNSPTTSGVPIPASDAARGWSGGRPG
jgi:hypothetical protein